MQKSMPAICSWRFVCLLSVSLAARTSFRLLCCLIPLLLSQVDMLPDIVKHVTGDNVVRVCSYLIACTDYASDQEERLKHLEVVYNSYMAAAHHPDALRVAMRMHDTERINAVIAATKDLYVIVVLRLALARWLFRC